MMSYYKKVVVLCLLGCTLSLGYASNLINTMRDDDFIDQNVKNILSQSPSTGSVSVVENNITKILNVLNDEYSSRLVVTKTPVSPQEKLSYSLGLLSQYLCDYKQSIINAVDDASLLDVAIENAIFSRGSCMYNNLPTRREAIRYYMLPDVGTLSTVSIPLAKKLGYSLSGFEAYLQGDLLDMRSEQFFFEEIAPLDIVPLMDLTQTELGQKRVKKFDKAKVIAYVETTNYPFFDDNIMIAVLAKKGDHYIKIVTPYEKIQYTSLGKITTLIQYLFERSIEDGTNDTIVSNKNFDRAYYTALKTLKIDDSLLQKHKVRQYLTVLRQNIDTPQGYIDFFAQSLLKDHLFAQWMQTELTTLNPFLSF